MGYRIDPIGATTHDPTSCGDECWDIVFEYFLAIGGTPTRSDDAEHTSHVMEITTDIEEIGVLLDIAELGRVYIRVECDTLDLFCFDSFSEFLEVDFLDLVEYLGSPLVSHPREVYDSSRETDIKKLPIVLMIREYLFEILVSKTCTMKSCEMEMRHSRNLE